MNRLWPRFRNKTAIILMALIPIGFWLLSIASSNAISGINWISGQYYGYHHQGYSGLLFLQQENLSRKKNVGNLFLPVSRKTPGFDFERFKFLLVGNIEIPKSGYYAIGTESDDGSWIWIDGVEVINNNGIHPRRVRTNWIHLTKGNHLIKIKFENCLGEAFLDFFWVKPDGNKFPLIIKTFDPKVIESILWITDSLRLVSTIFYKITIYWLVFFGAFFMYETLFGSHLQARGMRQRAREHKE